MPTVIHQAHPLFQVHDRHPLLHGLPVVLLCLAFMLAFLYSVLPEVAGLLGPGAGLEPSPGLVP
jgi:hypothetical protein